MRVTFCGCAAGVALDQVTGNLTLFNVIEKLMPSSLPIWLPSVNYAAIVRRDAQDSTEFNGTLTVNMGEKELFRTELRTSFTEGKNAIQMNLAIQGIPIESAGDLDFHLRDATLGDHKYTITVLPPRPAAQVQGALEFAAAQPAAQSNQAQLPERGPATREAPMMEQKARSAVSPRGE